MLFDGKFKLFDKSIIGDVNFAVGFDIAVNVFKIFGHGSIVDCTPHCVFVIDHNLPIVSRNRDLFVIRSQNLFPVKQRLSCLNFSSSAVQQTEESKLGTKEKTFDLAIMLALFVVVELRKAYLSNFADVLY